MLNKKTMLAGQPAAWLLPFLLLAQGVWADELEAIKAENARLTSEVATLTAQLAESEATRAELEAALGSAQASVAQQASAARARLERVMEEAQAVIDRQAREAQESIVQVAERAAVPLQAPAAISMDSGDDTIREVAFNAASKPAPIVAAKPVSSGPCNIGQVLSGYDGSGDANKKLGDWLMADNRARQCSTAELERLRKRVDFDFFGYSKRVLAVIDKELARR